MPNTNDGGAAFPGVFTDSYGVVQTGAGGMSLRDYFAAKALQGLLATERATAKTFEQYAEHAYLQADAMLAERAK